MSGPSEYPLGYSAEEQQRLKAQGAQLAQPTADVFRRAGLCPGMDVLDVGSGVGDVALLGAEMVGSKGRVLGVERAASSVETARLRVAQLGLANVAFTQSDLAEFRTDQSFDAIVGRFVLMYLPDPAAVLRMLVRHLRPGGIVAFVELDLSQISQTPPSELFLEARRWLLEGFAAGGADLDMGTRLYPTFLRAGLPPPDMVAMQPVIGGPTSQGYADLAQGVRTLLPVIERRGIATAAEIEVDTLAERLRAAALAGDRVIFMSRLIGAWAKVP
jgi:SAM-dependent methyltransferase